MMKFRLKQFGFKEHKVKGDGNCELRALAHCLYGSENRHARVRKKIIKELEENAEEYKEGLSEVEYKDYVEKMAILGEWGDFAFLEAVVNAFEVALVLLTSYNDAPFQVYYPRAQKFKKVIYLSYLADLEFPHYNAMSFEGNSNSIFNFATCHSSQHPETRTQKISSARDPAVFADALSQIYLDNAGDLKKIAKSIESSKLNFCRHGDTFFEVMFTGGHTEPGKTKPEAGRSYTFSILNCEAKREVIFPYVIYIEGILKKKPYLVNNFENVILRFLQCLELFEQSEITKLAIFTALAFSQNLPGLPQETFLQPLLTQKLVEPGISLSFITEFFKEYLIDHSPEDLIAILKRGKMEENLLDFFPSLNRSAEAFSEHFIKAGVASIAEEKISRLKMREVKSALTTDILEKHDILEVIHKMKLRVEDASYPEIEVVGILWDVLMGTVKWHGKKKQDNAKLAILQVKKWAQLLSAFCTSQSLELELLHKVHIKCYEDTNLKQNFSAIVISLFEEDVLNKNTIIRFFSEGTSRQRYPKALKTFVEGLKNQ